MEELVKAIAALQTDEERHHFLSVLLAPSELGKLRGRWSAIRCLLRGMSQREVRDSAKVSIATVSRAARLIHSDGAFLAKIQGRC